MQVAEIDPESVFGKYVSALSGAEKYRFAAHGETHSKVAFINYSQPIDESLVKDGDKYILTVESNSAFVKASQYAEFYSDKVLLKSSRDAEYEECSYDDYRSVYGFTPSDPLIAGFFATDCETVSEDSEKTVYKFVIDGNKYGQAMKKRMKKFGDLKDMPDFKSVEIVLTVDGGGMPQSVVLDSRYTVSVLFFNNVECEQHYELTYTF